MNKLKDAYVSIKTTAVFSLSLEQEAVRYYNTERVKPNTVATYEEDKNNITITLKTYIKYNGSKERMKHATEKLEKNREERRKKNE